MSLAGSCVDRSHRGHLVQRRGSHPGEVHDHVVSQHVPSGFVELERPLFAPHCELLGDGTLHSPQAPGRKERLYGTLQGRWPPELRVAGLTTMAAANQWLRAVGIPRFNRRFRVAPTESGSAFVATSADLTRVFSVQHTRTVSNANTVQLGRRLLQIGPTPLRCHFVRCRVTVHEHLDDTLSITYGPHVIARFDHAGQPLPVSAAA